VYELKAKCHLRTAQDEAKAYARTKSGPTGLPTYDSAYQTAIMAIDKAGKTRWQASQVPDPDNGLVS
jgi:hypothetical protein